MVRRLKAWAPLLATAGWFAGAVALWLAGQKWGWSPGELLLASVGWLAAVFVVAPWAVRDLFGPVFSYEIVRLGRRNLTVILRGLYVVALMALLALMYVDWLDDIGYFGYRSTAAVPFQALSGFATRFFYVFVAVQFGAVVFLTPAYVAGTIADEKERKTLEFLLATDLNNREIVFGKLAARVATLLMYVLAGVPVLAFIQLFGGIDPEQLAAATAATVLTVVGLSAVAVFFSVSLRRPRDAIALCYIAIVLYVIASFLLCGYVRFGLGRTGATLVDFFGTSIDIADYTDWIAQGNPAFVIATVERKTIGRGGIGPDLLATELGKYLLFWAVVAAVFLGVSVARLRAVALRQAYGGRRPILTALTQARVIPAPRRPPVGDDPMFWKEVFAGGGGTGCVGWVIFALIAGLVLMFPPIIAYNMLLDPSGWQASRPAADRWDDFTEAISAWVRGSTGAFGGLVLLAAAVRGAGAVTGERDRDTWISLIATPLTAWEMLVGKWWGVVLGLRWSYALLLLVWGIGLAVGAVHPVTVPFTVAALAVFVSGFAWLGIWCSCTARNTLVASVRAIMIGVFAAGGYWLVIGLCCALPFGILFRGGGRFGESLAQLALGFTPPMVLGWLPFRKFERWETEPFDVEFRDHFGPLPPVVGVGFWLAVNALLAWRSYEAFRTLSARAAAPPVRRRQSR